MSRKRIGGKTKFERLLKRYETTEKKCPECGYVDDDGGWTSETDGRKIVYCHVCPSCDATSEHTFEFKQ